MNNVAPDEIWLFLRELANIAAQETLPRFRLGCEVQNKIQGEGFDPVTEADRQAERALRQAIQERFPSHGIVGEEFGETVGASEWCWILDPIDGTRSYISGMPTWGTLIGLLKDNVPMYGMMSQPFVGDCFIGGNGLAQLVRPEGVTDLKPRVGITIDEATLFSTTPEMFELGNELNSFQRVSQKTKLTRFGADCYGYCLLAAGFVDLVLEANLGYYDIAPMIPIIESSGGVVSDWDGSPLRSGGRALAAASAELHNSVLNLLHS